ncbi:hypothetical protein PF002_g9182 [Phytophthora fragariae]|uniref:Pectate lyase n=1 Tax=Phytophthora fragariae TaxID=53985 RepID=A0A6A3LGL3_9STRA|nr:hypothetical protein PF009_g9301 [Phytophthora fragariae]KAE9017178.1 hypothetical protein PF011_g6817 [Phytophthora fragariae]KAE9241603.1 hypothetical protein PF002_g9182 [Phytophthora fragariae]KAE9346502.1 hypothetical protein PF008_g8263 [Phytophthora fragariae]
MCRTLEVLLLLATTVIVLWLSQYTDTCGCGSPNPSYFTDSRAHVTILQHAANN